MLNKYCRDSIVYLCVFAGWLFYHLFRIEPIPDKAKHTKYYQGFSLLFENFMFSNYHIYHIVIS